MTCKGKGARKFAPVTLQRPKAYSYLRFSTPEQRKGDSFRRQWEKAKAYADRHEPYRPLQAWARVADVGSRPRSVRAQSRAGCSDT
jgi:hypothetical protein